MPWQSFAPNKLKYKIQFNFKIFILFSNSESVSTFVQNELNIFELTFKQFNKINGFQFVYYIVPISIDTKYGYFPIQ